MAIITVTGNLRGFDGNGVAGKSLFFRVNPQIRNNSPTADTGRKEIKTDVNGDFSIDLQQGLLYVVRIPDYLIERVLNTPAEATIDLFVFWMEEDHQFLFFGLEES